MHGEEVTLAEALKPAGYVSGCFGKWHNGANHPSTARGQGFDEFFGFNGGFFSNYFDPVLEHDGVTAVRKGFITDVITNAAMAFIEKHRSRAVLLLCALQCLRTRPCRLRRICLPNTARWASSRRRQRFTR